MSAVKSIEFFRRFPDGSKGTLGRAIPVPSGWYFLPGMPGRKPSRKTYATWEQCLPNWIGYPDECEFRVIGE